MTVGLVAFLVVGSAGAVSPPRSGLVVDVSASRSASQIEESVEAAVRDFSRRAARLTESHRNALLKRGLYDRRIPFSLPVRVHLEGLPEGRGGGNQNQIQGNSIALVFDSSGPRAFPTAYRQLLQDVFNQARPTLDVIFGQPSQGGNVRVRNFDADIGDRDAVAGGYYLHDNGSGEREIRFPVYFSNEAAAVNFVHTVLLAYLGANDYGFDAFTEGLVRAATMRAVRTPGTLPAGLDPQVVESVLDNTYDVGTFYDWFNQRALGGAKFIAPNLRSVPLPPGGSLGGIYLARYQMAGSAWQKTLVEYPGFAAAFNEEFYANPGMRGDAAQLVALADQVLFTLGGPGSTLEGLPFADWFVRQHILETRDTLGPKLFVQPIPLPPIGGSPDFGVFLIQATFFETRLGGDEILLGGTSYPIFWTPNYDRIFPSGQEDSMPIAGAYGAVAPNLPNIFGGQPYRASVDIPVFDRINRTYVPAGAVATGSNTSENNFYGTVLGVPGGLNATIRIRVTIGSSVFDNIPVLNGAFGALISSTIFTNAARARVEVIRNESGVDTVFADRFVNKGPGPLALDLRANNGESVFSPLGGLPKGMSLIGLPLDPWAKTGGDLLQIAESQVLAARYNSARANYDIYPNTGPFVLGEGFFVRMDAAQPGFSIAGKAHPGTAVGVALRPGWNLVSPPLAEIVPVAKVKVVRGAELPKTYADATGVEIGTEFFRFAPGPPDAATGAPESGTLDAATVFEPGKGYFVRVLVPEGVTLLFEPNAILRSAGAASGKTKGSAPTPPPPAPDWLLQLRLVDGPYSSTAYVGQSRTATAGFDPREDSGLPPSLGGFQLTIHADETMFRDIRRIGQATTYELQATGLRPGRLYSLYVTYLGGPGQFTFTDLAIGAGGRIRGDWHYRFRANAPTRRFQVIRRAGW
jgi:hypothetical protein